MAVYKLMTVFTALKQGWSETLYWEGGSVDAALARGSNLITERLKFLADGVIVEGVRASETVPPYRFRWLYTQRGPLNDGAGKPTGAVPFQLASDAVVLQMSAENRYNRFLWCRGVPDLAIGRALPNLEEVGYRPDFLQKVLAYSALLAEGNFRVYSVSKEAADINEREVTNVTVTPAGLYLVACNPAGFAAGDTVRVSGVTYDGEADINRVRKVKTVQADGILLETKALTTADFEYRKGGKVRRQVKKFFPVDKCQLWDFSKRDTGRAFFVPRGRQVGRRS